jgi:glutaredoxin
MKAFAALAALVLVFAVPVLAADAPDVLLFYSETCPHCARERAFLDSLHEEFPEVVIERHSLREPEAQELLVSMLAAADGERYLGVVPITFVGAQFFVGFDDASGVGADIRAALQWSMTDGLQPPTSARSFVLPLIGQVNAAEHSLPALAVLLGLLDGFNICSLGALVLILGIVLALQDRRRILLFGGAFLATTALVYGTLIVLWFRAFGLLARFSGALEVLVSVLALGGGAFFLREWYRMHRFGPTCGFTGNRLVAWVTARVQWRLEGVIRFAPAVAAILLFAAVITIVEFPCSAAVPVVFAGILADAGISAGVQAALIALFVLCYLMDELIVFGIAVSRMRLLLTSPGVVVWATLGEAILLFVIGLWYLRGL